DNQQATLEAIDRRIEERRQIAREVASGRVTLLSAAVRFRDLYLRPPQVKTDIFRLYYPGQSEGECYCRQVIQSVAFELEEQESQDLVIVAQLEAELEDLLRRDGIVRLPDRG